MNVNPTKEKKLTNMRAVGHDRNILLKPARRLSLEEALEFIADDELVEVTPGADPPAEDFVERDRPPPGEPSSGVVIVPSPFGRGENLQKSNLAKKP